MKQVYNFGVRVWNVKKEIPNNDFPGGASYLQYSIR
jgi:hypothetical protein